MSEKEDIAGKIITSGISCMVIGLFIAILSPLTIALNGFVGCKVWMWLLIPSAAHVGLTVPPITWGVGVALYVFTTFFFKKSYSVDSKKGEVDNTKAMYGLAAPFLAPIFTLLIAYLINLIVF